VSRLSNRNRRGHRRQESRLFQAVLPEAEVCDVSIGGAGVQVREPLAPGERRRVELRDVEGRLAHVVEAEVTWHAPHPSDGGRAGLRWLNLTPEQQAWLRYRLPTTPIRVEVIALVLLCTLDMLTTAWWLHHGMATEANPILKPFAQAGLIPFAVAKTLSFLPAMALAEWYARLRPEFVVPWLRRSFTAYVGIYAALVLPQCRL